MISKQDKLIIHSNIISDTIGSSRTLSPTIIFTPSDKTKIMPELIKDNLLFRYMCFYMFSNTLIADANVNRVEQILPKILQINKRDIELFLEEAKNIDSKTSSVDVESIERTVAGFSNEEYDEYKTAFLNQLKKINLESFLTIMIGEGDNQLSKESLKDIFKKTSFSDFLKLLKDNPIDDSITFMDLDKNTKLRDYLSGQKGRYGKQEKKTTLRDADEFRINPKSYKEYIEHVKRLSEDKEFRDSIEQAFQNMTIDQDILDDHLDVLGKLETGSPLLFDNIMKYITVKTNASGSEEGDVILSEKVIQFNQTEYLREVFLNFGLGDIEKKNFELVSDLKIKKQDDAKTIFAGIKSTDAGKDKRTPLMFLSPRFKTKRTKWGDFDVEEDTRIIENIELVGNKNTKEFAYDDNGLSALASELNDIKDSYTNIKLKETIENLLFKNLNMNIPLTKLIIDTITPTDGKIVCGVFSMLLGKNDKIFKEAKEVEGLETYLADRFSKDSIYMKESQLEDESAEMEKKYDEFETMMNTNDASKLMGKVEKINLKKNFFPNSPRIRKPEEEEEEKEPKDLEYELVKDPYVTLNFTEILIKLFQKLVPIPTIVGGTPQFEEFFEEQTKKVVRGLSPDEENADIKTAIENYIRVLDQINSLSEKENDRLVQFKNLLDNIKSKISTNKGDFSAGNESKARLFFNLYKNKTETSFTGTKDRAEVDIDFKTLARTARKEKGIGATEIPIIEYKDIKFKKDGTVNAKNFSFKMGYRKKTATEEARQSKGGRAVVDNNKKGTKDVVDKNINRFLNTLVKNFKNIEGLV